MVQGYTKRLKALLQEHGCQFVRSGKGDHEVLSSPFSPKPIIVDGRMMSRHTANDVLKKAGIKAKI